MSLSQIEYLKHILDEIDYFGVDFELVWDIVTTKIPALKKQIGDILHIEE
ncbi:MAG: hypothetical protein QME25_01775 [Bacteroidota bacterium]|nr:hypothetical protein [Bacteroidota bacterium]